MHTNPALRASVHARVHACHKFVCVHVHTGLHACAQACTNVHVHASEHAHLLAWACSCMHACVRVTSAMQSLHGCHFIVLSSLIN